MNRARPVPAAAALLALSLPAAAASLPAGDIEQRIGFAPPLGDQVPLEVAVDDPATGRRSLRRALADYRHTVLVPVWYDCRKLCSITLDSLARAMESRPPPAGTQVIVYSINPAETAADARAARRELEEAHPASAGSATSAAWRFTTLAAADIGRLCRAIGFRFDFDEGHEQFRHVAGAVVLDADGVERAFLPGPQIRADELERALTSERPPVIARLASLCFAYDPQTGKYSLSVLRAIRVLAMLTIAAIAAMAVPAWRARRRDGKAR